MHLTQPVGFINLTCASLALVQTTNAEETSKFIADLSKSINATTTLYYCDKDGLLCDQLMRELKAPRLHLTTNHNIKLRGLYHASIMTVVTLKGQSAAELYNLQGLQKTILGWQDMHILFIVEHQLRNNNTNQQATLPTLNSWRWLFDWCWSNGYLNVLLLNASSTTNRKTRELLTYTPFPSLRVDYTSLSGYLQTRTEPPNFQGFSLHTGIGNNPPRAVLYLDKQGKQIVKGMGPELLRLFAWRYNATLEFVRVPVPANKVYMSLLCVQMLTTGQLDLCADFFISNNVVPTSQPVFLYKGYLLVRYPQPIDSYLYLFKPFSCTVWRVLAATFTFVILFTTVTSRLQFGAWHFGYFSLEIISSLLQTTFKLTFIRGRVQALMLTLLSLSGLVISSIYLTCLSSILTTQVYERPIESFEDLRDQNIPVLVTQEDKELSQFYSIPVIVQELFEVTPLPAIQAVQDVLDPRYAQLLFYDKCMLILYRQRFLTRPRAVALDKAAEIIAGGIPMKQNSPLQYLFDMHMLQSFDYGFHSHALNLALEEAMQYGNFTTFQTEYREVVPLNMAYFKMFVLLLASGYAIAFGSFLCEFLVHRLKKFFS